MTEQENKRNPRIPLETEISGSDCVPIYKTNFTKVILVGDCEQWVYNHVLKAADLALRPKVISLFEEVNKLLKKMKIDFSVQKENFVRRFLAARAIPYPKTPH